MATIHSLPPELIAQVFSLVSESSGYDPYRYPTLCAAALVCRAWRRLAQSWLWHKVHIAEPWRFTAFLKGTAATGLQTECLALWGRSKLLRAPSTVDVLRACGRLKELRISGYNDLDLQILEGPDLAELKSLVISECTFVTALTPSLDFAFKLSHFRFVIKKSHNCTLPLWTIPSFLFQPSITNLHLHIDAFSTPSDVSTLFLLSLLRLAPHLTTLRLIVFTHSHVRILAPFLHYYTSLRHLTGTQLNALANLAGIPAPLESWHDYSRPDFAATLETLRGMPVGQLKSIRFMIARPGLSRGRDSRIWRRSFSGGGRRCFWGRRRWDNGV